MVYFQIMSQITIEITTQIGASDAETGFLREAMHRVLMDEGLASATISLAIVTDAEIHRVNREFLGHDYPTDGISILLTGSSDPGEFPGEPFAAEIHPIASDHLDGEIIVSSETANREAPAHGWSPQAELLLYVVHGLLHLCGYDDLTDEARPVMRSRERELLALWGFCPTGLEI